MTESAILTLDHYPENGCAVFGSILDPAECVRLRERLRRERPLDASMFYETEDAFERHGRWHRYAPGPGHNILEAMSNGELDFIERNPAFVDAATRLVGPGYGIMKKSVIRSVPSSMLPRWLYDKVVHVGRSNLNPFIRDDFQDIQYFHATDFHQDKTRPKSDFVTVYIYLDNVEPHCSALQILVGSHKLGMTPYPHSLRHSYVDKQLWYYSDGPSHLQTRQTTFVGPAGTVSCFHGLTLHGTNLNMTRDPRISLRYLLTYGDNFSGDCLQRQANALVTGPLAIEVPRYDVDKEGRLLPIGSALLAWGHDR